MLPRLGCSRWPACWGLDGVPCSALPYNRSYHSGSTFLINAFQESTCRGNGYRALLHPVHPARVWHAHHHLGVVESNWRLDIYTPMEICLLLKWLHTLVPFESYSGNRRGCWAARWVHQKYLANSSVLIPKGMCEKSGKLAEVQKWVNSPVRYSRSGSKEQISSLHCLNYKQVNFRYWHLSLTTLLKECVPKWLVLERMESSAFGGGN